MEAATLKAAYPLATEEVTEARSLAREALEIALQRGERFWAAVAMEHLAGVAVRNLDLERAARIVGYVDKVYALEPSLRECSEQVGYERILSSLHAVYDDSEVARLLGQGQSLDETTAAAYAMAIGPFSTKKSPF